VLIGATEHQDFFKTSFMSSKATTKRSRKQMRANHCIQLTADQRVFNIFSVSFCEVICNQRHQAAATDAGRYVFKKRINKFIKWIAK